MHELRTMKNCSLSSPFGFTTSKTLRKNIKINIALANLILRLPNFWMLGFVTLLFWQHMELPKLYIWRQSPRQINRHWLILVLGSFLGNTVEWHLLIYLHSLPDRPACLSVIPRSFPLIREIKYTTTNSLLDHPQPPLSSNSSILAGKREDWLIRERLRSCNGLLTGLPTKCNRNEWRDQRHWLWLIRTGVCGDVFNRWRFLWEKKRDPGYTSQMWWLLNQNHCNQLHFSPSCKVKCMHTHTEFYSFAS